MSGHNGWIGVDLDGTFAHYEKWVSIYHVGEPVPAMLERVKRWRAAGQKVKIFTARVDDGNPTTLKVIQDWSLKHVGEVLPVTNIKDSQMTELWDDRAITVEKNTGRIIAAEPRVP